MRRNTFYPQVALLQLAARDHAWLIDPLTITDLDSLRGFFRRPDCLKVLHSCSEDLEVFRHWLGVSPEPLVATQRAAALLGEAHGISYRGLVEQLPGDVLDKGETRSNWLQRPLSESQCHYAAQDVLYLVPVWQEMRHQADSRGRLPWVLEEGQQALRQIDEREHEAFRRVKGAGRLTPRQLAILRSLYQWREQRARHVDKPRGWVLEDRVCVAIALALPQHLEALAAIEGMPASVVRRQGDTILRLVADAQELSATALPEGAPTPLTSSQRSLLKALKTQLRQLCDDAGIAPELAMTASDLEKLIRQERDSSDGNSPERWQGWRHKVIVEPLRGFLEKSQA